MNKKNVKKITTLYKRLSTAVIGVVMALSIIAFLSLVVQIAGGHKPSVFGYRFYYIITDSMTPELQVNDVILSETINNNAEARTRIKKGDVVTFVAEYGVQKGLTITHKVVKAPYVDESGNEVVETQGTKEGATIDPPVPLENVQSVMVRKVACIGNAYRFVMSGIGLLLIIIVPLGIMLIVLICRLFVSLKTFSKSNDKLSNDEIGKKAVEEFIERKRREEEIKQKAIADYIKENEENSN